MLLQNLTLLSNDMVVQVTNIAPPSTPKTPDAGEPVAIVPIAPLPVIVSPILAERPPQRSTQIIVSTSAPGRLGSSTVYTGEASINGLESARRAAQAAADRARLQADDRDSAAAKAAYREAAELATAD